MKNLKLIELNLENFKGIEKLQLTLNGLDANAFGDNETGKTTLFDAFSWLLTGKNSNNKTDFEIKGLDENGKVKQHGLEHMVEGIFQFGEDTFSLKRVYKENWTKKRGSRKKVFTGHTTKYFIDEVPKKKKEYEEKINEIVPDNVFKLITNPLHFNENYEWKERRKMLVDIAGDVTDEEVANSNKDLSDFIDKIQGKDVEDLKKIIKEKQKAINKELDIIPIRIDEIQLSMDDTSHLDENLLKADKESVEIEIGKIEEVISDIKNGAEINKKRKLVSEIDLEISEIKNKFEQQEMNDIYRIKASIQEKESNINLRKNDLSYYDKQIKGTRKRIEGIEKDIQELRDKWTEENEKAFNHEENCFCPTCNQELQAEKVEEAVKEFNVNKSNLLEKIVKEGNDKKVELKELQDELEKFDKKKMDLEKEIMKEENKVSLMQDDLKDLEEKAVSINENSDYLKKSEEKEQLQDEILVLINAENEAVEKQKSKLEELNERKNEIENELGLFSFIRKAEKRINELEEKERILTGEYEELEKDLFNIETYVRTKISLLEEKINKKFKYAKFKLFEEQINEGINETCEAIYKGVPYSRGLNNAHKIIVGLDIINTLNEHYGITAPIFIDNSESVTKLIDTHSQIIRLVVSETAKQLDIVINNEEEKTA